MIEKNYIYIYIIWCLITEDGNDEEESDNCIEILDPAKNRMSDIWYLPPHICGSVERDKADGLPRKEYDEIIKRFCVNVDEEDEDADESKDGDVDIKKNHKDEEEEEDEDESEQQGRAMKKEDSGKATTTELDLDEVRKRYGSDDLFIQVKEKKQYKIYDINECASAINKKQKLCPISLISIKKLDRENAYTNPQCGHTFHRKATLKVLMNKIKQREQSLTIGFSPRNQIDLRSESVRISNIEKIEQSQRDYVNSKEDTELDLKQCDDIRICLYCGCTQFFEDKFVQIAIDMYDAANKKN